jgi:DNA polymerase-4
LIELAENVGRRLRRAERMARTGHLKVRFSDFQTVTRQQALPRPTHTDRDLLDAAVGLFGQQKLKRPVRLIGFGVSGLLGASESERPVQQELFAEPIEPAEQRQRHLDAAVDSVRERFGRGALKRGDWRDPPTLNRGPD